MKIDFSKLKPESKEPPCKGLIFRGHVNHFLNSKNEVVYSERMSPLKRMSCKGCSKCGWLWEDLRERMLDYPAVPIYNNPSKESGVIDKALYQLKVTDISHDWESGHVDDWEIGFVQVKENE